MATAYTTLTLTGGAATRNLVDGTNYSLVDDGWAPSVPGLRRSRLAGSGPYDDGVEEIQLNVLGDTGPIAHANLLALADDCDQAHRWRLGEEIDPILLNIQPQGSDLAAALSVPIWGGDVPLGLPANYNDHLMIYEIGPVVLRFRRPGQWIGELETPSSAAAQTHPNVFTVTFASDETPKLLPLALDFSNMLGSRDGSSNPIGSDAYLMVASHADKIKKLEAESATATAPGAGTFNTSADANASGGSIRRLAPNASGDYTLLSTVSPDFEVDGRALFVTAVVVRNNSTSINYTAHVTYYENSSVGFSDKSSPSIVIDTSTQDPRVILFDPVAFDGQPNRVKLTFTPSATGGAANELDVDVYVVLQVVDPTDRIVGLLGINKNDVTSVTASLVIDHRVLTDPLPAVTQFVVGGQYQPGHRGDIYLLTTGDQVAACLVGTTSTNWRIVNGTVTGAPTAVSSEVTASRRLAYRVPQ